MPASFAHQKLLRLNQVLQKLSHRTRVRCRLKAKLVGRNLVGFIDQAVSNFAPTLDLLSTDIRFSWVRLWRVVIAIATRETCVPYCVFPENEASKTAIASIESRLTAAASG